MQPDLLRDGIDRLGFLVDEDAYQVWLAISVRKARIALHQRAGLPGRKIAVAWRVKDETEHICPRVYGGVNVFSRFQAADFHLRTLVGSRQQRAHLPRHVLRNDQRFAYQHGLHVIAGQPPGICCVMNAAFGYHNTVRRQQAAQVANEVGMHCKGDEVAAVHANDAGSGFYSALGLFDAVNFDQAVHALRASHAEQVAQLSVVEQGADEQDGVRAPRTGLVHLVLVKDEIFAENRETDRMFDGGQVRGRAEKEVRLGQHGDGGGSIGLVGARQFHRVEVRCEQAL